MIEKRLKILLGVVSRTGFVAWDHARSVAQLYLQSLAFSQRTGVTLEWIESSHRGGSLSRGRNAQCAAALYHGCDAILFIDDDIGFDPQDVFRMIGHGVAVIGAVPQKRNHRWDDPPKMAIAPEGLRIDPATGLAVPPEPKLPMAMTFIATQVLRDMREQGLVEPQMYAAAGEELQPFMAGYFGWETNPCPEYSREYELAQKLGIENPVNEDGEDHYFCRRANKAGYDIVIDTNFELRHWEGQVLHDYSYKKLFASGDVEMKPQAQDEAA